MQGISYTEKRQQAPGTQPDPAQGEHGHIQSCIKGVEILKGQLRRSNYKYREETEQNPPPWRCVETRAKDVLKAWKQCIHEGDAAEQPCIGV